MACGAADRRACFQGNEPQLIAGKGYAHYGMQHDRKSASFHSAFVLYPKEPCAAAVIFSIEPEADVFRSVA